jgi:hypothetical protein
MKGFVVLPRRWVVERTFAHLMRHRRLVRCYERTPEHHEAMIWWATISIMTRRLTRHLADEPPHGRWSDPPPPPALTSPDRRGKVCELLAAQPWRAWKGCDVLGDVQPCLGGGVVADHGADVAQQSGLDLAVRRAEGVLVAVPGRP